MTLTSTFRPHWNPSTLRLQVMSGSGDPHVGGTAATAIPCSYCTGDTPIAIALELSDVVKCLEDTCYAVTPYAYGCKLYDIVDVSGEHVLTQASSCSWIKSITGDFGNVNVYDYSGGNYCAYLKGNWTFYALNLSAQKITASTVRVIVSLTSGCPYLSGLDFVNAVFTVDSDCVAVDVDYTASGACGNDEIATAAHVKITEF